MNIGELCSRDLVSVPANARLIEVARAMKHEHVGLVVITKSPADEPVPAGVITDRDVACAMADCGADTADLRAENVMKCDPLVLCEEDSVESAIVRMRDRGVRRAPVVTAQGRLAGVISTDDLIAHLAGELGSLARLLEQQPARERHGRRPVFEQLREGALTGSGHGI